MNNFANENKFKAALKVFYSEKHKNKILKSLKQNPDNAFKNQLIKLFDKHISNALIVLFQDPATRQSAKQGILLHPEAGKHVLGAAKRYAKRYRSPVTSVAQAHNTPHKRLKHSSRDSPH